MKLGPLLYQGKATNGEWVHVKDYPTRLQKFSNWLVYTLVVLLAGVGIGYAWAFHVYVK